MRVYAGTAQWGMAYGVSNATGVPDDSTVLGMVSLMRSRDYFALDTAGAYGIAEERIGHLAQGLPVQTKVSGGDIDILATLERLQRTRVEGVLVHDWADLDESTQRAAAACLGQVRAIGFARRIGVSAYTADDVRDALLRFPGLDVIQVPGNALDLSVLDSPAVAHARQAGVKVQVRSVYLQGALVGPSRFVNHPDVARFTYAARAAAMSPTEAALSVIAHHPAVDEIVVGFATARELLHFDQVWSAGLRQFDATGLQSTDRSLTDPRAWKPAA